LRRPGLQDSAQRSRGLWRRAVLVVIPVHQRLQLPRERILLGPYLAAFAPRIIVVSAAEEAPLAAGERIQHPVTLGIGATIGDAVLVDVDDDARAECAGEPFARCAIQDFALAEPDAPGLLSM